MAADSIFDRILLNQTWAGDQPVFISPGQTATWGEMTDLVRSLDLDELGLVRHRVGIVFRPVPACIAALALLDRLECDTFLMDGLLGRDDAIRLGTELKLSTVLIGSDAPNSRTIEPVILACELPGSGRSSVTILTSGTTGKPKAARHTWSSLSRPVRVAVHPTGPRWLLTYRPHLYAGIQVVLQSLVNGGTLVVPEPDASPSAVAELMRSARVEYASATPSYWRRLLLFADPAVLAATPLVQITLGGEVVDQQILDALRRAFPATRTVHIYATTEARTLLIGDGRQGGVPRPLSPRADPGRHPDANRGRRVSGAIGQCHARLRSRRRSSSIERVGPSNRRPGRGDRRSRVFHRPTYRHDQCRGE